MAKMNSTNLYVTTTQIILKCDPTNPTTWQDLYRLVPYLRNSLSCVVCGNLLVDPITPTDHKCQHHLCKKCKGGRKRIKPACTWCKDCDNYSDNNQLRILIQCYKQMCLTLLNSGIYKTLEQTSTNHLTLGVECGSSNLMYLIKEGATFQDDYRSNVGLSKAEINILPCIYTNSSTQTLQVAAADGAKTIYNANTRTPVYSVLYAGNGSKITIKRKGKEATEKVNKSSVLAKRDISEKGVFKKPVKCVVKQRRGCRCGNATPTPGKLTCCGQRCPCYVESKACIDCKCRGCRNPHTPDGNKVINLPHILKQFQEVTNQSQQQTPTFLQQRQIYQMSQPKQDVSMLQAVKIELDANLTLEQLNEHLTMNGRFRSGTLIYSTFKVWRKLYVLYRVPRKVLKENTFENSKRQIGYYVYIKR